MLRSAAAATVIVIACASPSTSAERADMLRRVQEPSLPLHYGWRRDRSSSVDAATPLTFTLVVREQGGGTVERIARRVSDPGSENYGQYLSQRRLDELTAPLADDLAAVSGWLGRAGMRFTRRSVSSFVVNTTVGEACRLLNTSFSVLRRVDATSLRQIAAGDIYVPAEVAATFGLGHGLPSSTRQPPKQRRAPRRAGPTEGGPWPPEPCHPTPHPVTPPLLLTQYGVETGPSPQRSRKNRQAIVNFNGEWVNSTDTALAFETWVPEYKAGTDDVPTFVGDHATNCYDPSDGRYDGGCGIASNLETQYAMMVSKPCGATLS